MESGSIYWYNIRKHLLDTVDDFPLHLLPPYLGADETTFEGSREMVAVVLKEKVGSLEQARERID